MALFKKTAAKKAAPKAKAAPAASTSSVSSASNLTGVLKHARITEKASDLQGQNVYVFDIAVSASKRDISRAVQSLYKVTPRKIAVISVRRKAVRNARTGREGMKGGGRKAYVFLKQGDSITF